MLGFFRPREENIHNLKSFKKWMTRFDFDPACRTRMIYEYSELGTPEQRLYAAYTAFSDHLKNLIKAELDLDSETRKQSVLKTIYIVLEKKGLHGCSFLLKQDYREEFFSMAEQEAEKQYKPIPSEWLREAISFEELAEFYNQTYESNIENHSETLWSSSHDGLAWSRILKLYKEDCEIKNFDSGFCRGIALIKDEKPIQHVVVFNYRRTGS